MARGAGGTNGGLPHFFIGLGMLVAGGYLFLDSITVTTGFGLGYGLYRFGNFNLTSGMLLLPFMAGVALIFYNRFSKLGWALAGAAVLALLVGVLRSIRFVITGMSAFDFLLILVLVAGGLGLFLASLRDLR